jgi:hypothetical protein
MFHFVMGGLMWHGGAQCLGGENVKEQRGGTKAFNPITRRETDLKHDGVDDIVEAVNEKVYSGNFLKDNFVEDVAGVLLEDEKDLMAPTGVIVGVSVEDGGDEVADILHIECLSVQIDDGNYLMDQQALRRCW